MKNKKMRMENVLLWLLLRIFGDAVDYEALFIR